MVYPYYNFEWWQLLIQIAIRQFNKKPKIVRHIFCESVLKIYSRASTLVSLYTFNQYSIYTCSPKLTSVTNIQQTFSDDNEVQFVNFHLHIYKFVFYFPFVNIDLVYHFFKISFIFIRCFLLDTCIFGMLNPFITFLFLFVCFLLILFVCLLFLPHFYV